VILLGWTPGHPGQCDEVLRDEGQSALLQQQWAGDELLGAGCKLLNHEISLLQRREADTDRKIESLAQHVHPSVRAFEMHIDLRILGHEAGDHPANLKIEHRGRAAHAHNPPRLGACLINGLLRRLGFNPYCQAMAKRLEDDQWRLPMNR